MMTATDLLEGAKKLAGLSLEEFNNFFERTSKLKQRPDLYNNMNKQEKVALIEDSKRVIKQLKEEQDAEFSELCGKLGIEELSFAGECLFDYTYNDLGYIEEILET